LKLEEFFRHCCLQNAKIDGVAGTQFLRIKFAQAIIESAQAL